MSPLSKPLALKLQVFLVLLFLGATSAQLSSRFYDTSCPNALSMIRYGVQRAVSNEARMGASLLRLHFHDCFVNGCDGSVLLADNGTFQGEQNSRSNKDSLRGFNVIDTIKSQIERACPGIVSCADIVAVAARDSVVALGGPSWTVQLGRRDATPTKASLINDANNNIPSPLLGLGGLHDLFSRKGFNDDELVALSGAHTIGQARCVGFRTRIYTEANIDPSFKAKLQNNCPMDSRQGDRNLAALDSSPNRFDNAYFNDLTKYRGLLHSDQVLYGYHSVGAQVSKYGWYSSAFFNDFANAMVKMGSLGPLTGSRGQIRATCSRAN